MKKYHRVIIVILTVLLPVCCLISYNIGRNRGIKEAKDAYSDLENFSGDTGNNSLDSSLSEAQTATVKDNGQNSDVSSSLGTENTSAGIDTSPDNNTSQSDNTSQNNDASQSSGISQNDSASQGGSTSQNDSASQGGSTSHSDNASQNNSTSHSDNASQNNGASQDDNTQSSSAVPALTSSATPSAKPSVSENVSLASVEQLTVKGSGLYTISGRRAVLRGVSTHGIGWFPQFATKDYMKVLKDEWGINVFRIAMYTETGEGYLNNKKTTMDKVCTLIDAAVDLDIYVIVDWHILSDGNPKTYQSEAITFFNSISEKYANVPNVIYEICNEPNGAVSWDNDIKPYAEAVIPAIRKNSPDAVIIVGTPTWSQDVDAAAANPLNFDNVMYALHFYSGTHKDWLRDKALLALNSGIALFVSEFGTTDASGNGNVDTAETDKWLKFLDENYISWCNWSLCDKNESSAIFKSGFSLNGTIPDSALTVSGAYIKSALLKGSGNDTGSGSASSQNTIVPTTAVSQNDSQQSGTNSASGSSGPQSSNDAAAKTGTVPDGNISVLTYNNIRTEKSNTINVYFKITNNHTEALDLTLLKLRYYYTPENKVKQNFWCDWSDVNGAGSSVYGSFPELTSEPFYAEIGFTNTAGMLMPGESIVLQSRIAAEDWSEYIQTNDASFLNNASAYSENKTIKILY